MATAVTKALTTPELLEAILHELPLKKLLVVQRVDKLWKSTIGTSPTLQQKLFLAHAPSTAGKLPQLNPAFPGMYECNYGVALMDAQSCKIFFIGYHNKHNDPSPASAECNVIIFDKKGPAIETDEHASWNAMLLTDQVCPIYFVKSFARRRGGPPWPSFAVRQAVGQTLGEVVRELRGGWARGE